MPCGEDDPNHEKHEPPQTEAKRSIEATKALTKWCIVDQLDVPSLLSTLQKDIRKLTSELCPEKLTGLLGDLVVTLLVVTRAPAGGVDPSLLKKLGSDIKKLAVAIAGSISTFEPEFAYLVSASALILDTVDVVTLAYYKNIPKDLLSPIQDFVEKVNKFGQAIQNAVAECLSGSKDVVDEPIPDF